MPCIFTLPTSSTTSAVIVVYSLLLSVITIVIGITFIGNRNYFPSSRFSSTK